MGKSDASLGGVNMHLKSMSRCSWVVVGPISSGPIVPRTVWDLAGHIVGHLCSPSSGYSV